MLEQYAQLLPDADETYSDAEPRYFTWRAISENRAFADIDEDDTPQVTSDENAAFDQEAKLVCLHCGHFALTCHCENPVHVPLYQVMERKTQTKNGKSQQRLKPLSDMNECCRCHDKSVKGTEIATPVSVAGVTPLSVLTNELYRALPASPETKLAEKPGGGRKLLTFYDSRQGAARFAAFLQDVTNETNYRHIIPIAVRELWMEKDFLPDFEAVAQRCTDLAWKSHIFHNDPATEEWRHSTSQIIDWSQTRPSASICSQARICRNYDPSG